MAHPMGESKEGVLRLDFDRRLKLEFHGSKVTSDAGLLPYRELDDALGLTEIAGDALTDTRRGKNGRHGLVGQFRQSVSRPGLQSGLLHVDTGFAEEGGALVADHGTGLSGNGGQGWSRSAPRSSAMVAMSPSNWPRWQY